MRRMNAYSEDLRKKIVEALKRGTTKSEAARTFGVSRSSVKRYAKLAEERRSLAPKKRPGSKPKIDERARRLLEADLEERPSATLSERREYLGGVAGLSVSESTVSRMLRRLGWCRKKDLWERQSATSFEVRLAATVRPDCRGRAFGIRGRDGSERLAFAALRLVAPRAAGPREGAAQLGQERDLAGEHHSPRLGSLPSGRRLDHKGGLRDLPGARLGSNPGARAGRGAGQSLGPQGRQGEGDRRGRRMRALLYLPPYSPDLKWDEKAEITLREEPTMVST
jgi:transposase